MRGNITRLIDIYSDQTGLSRSYIGILCARDGKFYRRISAGGDVTSRTYFRVLQWFSDHWPAGLPWPEDIPRPAPTAATHPKEAA